MKKHIFLGDFSLFFGTACLPIQNQVPPFLPSSALASIIISLNYLTPHPPHPGKVWKWNQNEIERLEL